MKNREIRRKYSALDSLSGRVLPSLESEQKVAVLLRKYFSVPFLVTEDLRQRTAKELPIPADWEGAGMPLALAEARQIRLEEMLEQSQEVPEIPEALILTKADLPKTLKQVEDNRQGVANIIASLDDLYKSDEE